MSSFFCPRFLVVAGALLLAGSLPACQPRAGESEKLAAKTVPPVARIDTAALRRLAASKRLAWRLDSLRADSIAHQSGQLPGAIFPGHRVVAFYGNIRSKKMGILGRVPKDQLFSKLDSTLKAWQAADPTRPVLPALHSVTITAQADAGADGKYRLLNTDSTIRETRRWAQAHGCLLFLDVQVGLSDLQHELPRLTHYLLDPTVHLGIDPEFAMATKGALPGKKIGTFDAKDINFAINFLAHLVSDKHLPPKILVVHRFTRAMVTNYQNIRLDPRVQLVMDMDGWGSPHLKKGSYKAYIKKEPVQYAGFKLFYEHDIKNKPHHLMTPQEVLADLRPQPLYIQYQ